jgi:hypothetical protein
MQVFSRRALDRLSRKGIVKTLGYLEQLRRWGCGWRSYTQPFLDTGNEMTNGIVLSVLALDLNLQFVLYRTIPHIVTD